MWRSVSSTLCVSHAGDSVTHAQSCCTLPSSSVPTSTPIQSAMFVRMWTHIYTRGAASKGEPAAFACENYGYEHTRDVPKRVRVFLSRCSVLARDSPIEMLGKGCPATGATAMQTAWKKRKRKHGFQGRPKLSGELHHQLLQWFLLIRKSVKGRLWPRDVKHAAEAIKNASANGMSTAGSQSQICQR